MKTEKLSFVGGHEEQKIDHIIASFLYFGFSGEKRKSIELKVSNVLLGRIRNNACLQVLGNNASCSSDMESQKVGLLLD